MPGAGRRTRAARPLRRARRAAARPRPSAVGVHAHRGARRRARRAAAEGPPHDHRRRRRPAALARARRLRARPRAVRRRADDEPTGRRRSARHAAAASPATRSPTRRARGVDASARNARRRRRHVLAHPTELPARAADAARLVGSLQRQVLVTDAARSDVMHARSLRRHFEIATSARSQRVQRAASSSAAASTTCSSPASRARSAATTSGSAATVDELRLAMPISTRERGDARRRTASCRRACSCRSNPRRLAALFGDVHERLAAAQERDRARRRRGTRRARVAGLPTSLLVALTRSQTRTIDFAASNLRGSPVPLYLAGARIIGELPVRAAHRHARSTSRCSSYCDELHLGLNIDPAAIIDVDAFMRDVARRVRRRSRVARADASRARAGRAPRRRRAIRRRAGRASAGAALGRRVDDVEVQRRRFVGEVDELARTGARAGRVEQVDERDRGDTRERQSGHAETVAASRPSVTHSSEARPRRRRARPRSRPRP